MNYLKSGRKHSYMTMINLLLHWSTLMLIVVNVTAEFWFCLFVLFCCACLIFYRIHLRWIKDVYISIVRVKDVDWLCEQHCVAVCASAATASDCQSLPARYAPLHAHERSSLSPRSHHINQQHHTAVKGDLWLVLCEQCFSFRIESNSYRRSQKSPVISTC